MNNGPTSEYLQPIHGPIFEPLVALKQRLDAGEDPKAVLQELLSVMIENERAALGFDPIE